MTMSGSQTKQNEM